MTGLLRRLLGRLSRLFRRLFRPPPVRPCAVCGTPVERPPDGRPVCLADGCWERYRDLDAW